MIAKITTSIRLVDEMPLPPLCSRAAPCPSMDKTPAETRLWKRWTINFAHLAKRGNIMKSILALFLLAGSMLSAQTPCVNGQYRSLDGLCLTPPQPAVTAEMAAFDANTAALAQIGRDFLAADADLRIALAQQQRQQRRFRREPWHREFWRRR